MGEVTEDQEAIYDRQIRVWGVEAQKRLTDAKLLIIGGRMLAAEVAKNTVLAGIGNVGLFDDGAPKTSENFLLMADVEDGVSVAEASARTLREMNPMIKIQVETLPTDDPSLSPLDALARIMSQYDIIVAETSSFSRLNDLDKLATRLGKKIIAGVVRGQSGIFFVNLQTHEWYEKREASHIPAPSIPSSSPTLMSVACGDSDGMIFKKKVYPSLENALMTPLGKFGRRLNKLLPIAKALYLFEKNESRPAAATDISAIEALATKEVPNGTTIDNDILLSFIGDDQTLAPLSVILGGIVANGVIQALAAKETPLSNFITYNLFDGTGGVVELSGNI